MLLKELRAAPPTREVGRALVDWVNELRARILRGDMMIGILTPEEVALAPDVLRKAHECGIDEALLALGDWLAAPPLGEPDVLRANAVFRDAINAGVPGARLRFVEFVWFCCREAATSEERFEAYRMTRELAEQDGENARATHLLGLITYAGFGTTADPVRACVLQKAAAAKGDADAMFEALSLPRGGDWG